MWDVSAASDKRPFRQKPHDLHDNQCHDLDRTQGHDPAQVPIWLRKG